MDVEQSSDPNSKPDDLSKVNGPLLLEPSKEDLLLELYGGYFDLFFALFNNVLYKASNYPEEAYFFADMFGIQVPICEHIKVAEYIEITCKKLVSLLCTNSLDGFQLNLTDHSIVLQRFVFEIDGRFTFQLTNKRGVKRELDMLAQYGREIIGKLNQSEDIKMLRTKVGSRCQRFQLALGLKEHVVETYKDKVHGPFTGDVDLDFFPWTKPRKKPSNALKIHAPFRSQLDMLATLAIGNENSASGKSPQLDDSEPTVNADGKQVTTSTSATGSCSYDNLLLVPIATFTFGGSLRSNFYSVAFTKVFNARLTPRSGFSPSNIDSPGLYRAKGRVNNVSTLGRRRSPLSKTASTEPPRVTTPVLIRSSGITWNQLRTTNLSTGRQQQALLPCRKEIPFDKFY